MDECYVNEEKCVQIPAPGPEGEIVPRRNVEIPSHCISIEPLNRGFVVRVGCQSLAVSSKQELVKLFNAYMENPKKVEKDWMGEGKLPE